MNIVILDAHTSNPGDLNWDSVADLGTLDVYPDSDYPQIFERAQHKQAILTNKAILDAPLISHLPDLQYIGVIATGYNTVDISAAAKRGIPVCNAPGYGRDSVAQHVFALLLELTNHVGLHDASTHSGEWSRSPYWTYTKAPMTELAGKTIGVVGLGEIGHQVVRIAQAFGMQVLGNNRSPRQIEGVSMVGIEELFSRSDVVSLNCPLTQDNRGFVNAQLIRLMKPTSLLINTARGPLIDEPALLYALESRQIGGAGLDVLSVEPPPADHPLFQAPNCIITPHNAWGTRESRARLIEIVADNLRAFIAGHPQHVVNSPL